MEITDTIHSTEIGAAVSLWEQFSQLEPAPAWLQSLRKGAISHFAELGIPTTDDEEWRFTNVAPIAKLPLHLGSSRNLPSVSASDVEGFSFSNMPGHLLVFIDGRFDAGLSRLAGSEQGLTALSLREAIAESEPALQQHLGRHSRIDENAFAALNTAFLSDGAHIAVAPGVALAHPIHLLYVATGASSVVHARNLITLGRGAQAKVIESYLSYRGSAGFPTRGHSAGPSALAGTYLTNSVTEIVLGQDAQLEHCKVQRESKQAYHIASINSYHERGAKLLNHSVSIGSLLARNTITCLLDGQYSETTLNGLYIADGNQLVDHHTAIHHAKPNCPSHEYYHGILDGRSQGVFNGKIFVRPEAQKTDAKQTNRNLLLSDDAVINTKPQLEIFADDVKCTHGAVVGQMEEEQLFYLRSRGIPLARARKILIHAFASEIINRITLEPVREELDTVLFDLYEKE